MQYSTLKQWYNGWKDVKEIVLFGYGKTCKYHLPELTKFFSVSAIMDNYKGGEIEAEYGIPIYRFDDYASELKGKKIVIISAYQEIAAQLKDCGLQEYVDFCEVRLFVTGWQWFHEQQLHLSEVHIALTTYCTLNCRNCNMFIPSHRRQRTMCHVSYDRICRDLDLLFSKAQRVYRISFVGGETLMAPDLFRILQYLHQRYKDRYNSYEIYTNGTIMPDEALRDWLKQTKGILTISDYQIKTGGYQEKLNDLIHVLDREDISYSLLRSDEWLDFAFPNEAFCVSEEKALENMQICNPGFRGFNDGKFYFCHIVWSAVEAGILEDVNTDYVDFKQNPTIEEIIFHHLGIVGENYVSLCKRCRGCSNLFKKVIPAAIQEEME